jgi:hypothetical protein
MEGKKNFVVSITLDVDMGASVVTPKTQFVNTAVRGSAMP